MAENPAVVSTMFRVQADESTSMTTQVTPRPVKNAAIAAAMTSASAPNRAVWKKSVSWAASSGSCPTSRKIQAGQRDQQQKQRDAVKPEPPPCQTAGPIRSGCPAP